MTDRTDEELLRAAREGDRRALDELLTRHQPRVYRFGKQMCGDPEDAKDVLQETLLAMARTVRSFRGASSVSTWAYTIARSFCIKKRRRSKFAPAQERSLDGEGAREAQTLIEPKRLPDEELAARQVETALEQAIGSLDPGYREVLVLRDVEGLSAPEVAAVLDLSVDAVKSRLHRARVMVRERVAERLADPARASAAPATAPAAPCPHGDVVTMLSRRLEGDITAESCAEMERHITTCEPCRAACDSLKRTLATCRAAGAEQVPVEVQASVRRALQELLDRAG